MPPNNAKVDANIRNRKQTGDSMKITNNLGPHCSNALYNAAQESLYEPVEGQIRVSELIDAPIIRRLRILHANEITIPVERIIPSLMGTAWHSLMEKHTNPSETSECRMYREYPEFQTTLTGQLDNYNPTTCAISDYKETSVMKFIHQDFSSWEKQQNIYADLANENNMPVKTIHIYVNIKDWNKYKAFQGGNYPKFRHMKLSLPLWTHEQADAFIRQRLALHAQEIPDICTPEERWQKETQYALMKKGRKSAVRCMDSPQEIQDYAINKNIKIDGQHHWIQERPGEDTRCEGWCDVCDFCPYYQQLKEAAA